MATRENKFVILNCPYGSFKPYRSRDSIMNGARGLRIVGGGTIAVPIIEFEGHRPCNVPEAWLLADHYRSTVAQIKDDEAHPVSAGWQRGAVRQGELIGKIAAALGTDECGEALVEIARNAHWAEQKLAIAAALINREIVNRNIIMCDECKEFALGVIDRVLDLRRNIKFGDESGTVGGGGQ